MPPEFLRRKLSWLEKPFWMKEEATLSATAPVSKRDRGAAPPKASEGRRVRSRGRAGSWRSIGIKMVRHHLGYAARMPSKLTLAGGKKKRDGPRRLLPCTPPSLHSSPAVSHNAPAMCVKSKRKKREGIPFDLDRHANVGGHATAMEHPTAQQHRGPGSLAARASL